MSHPPSFRDNYFFESIAFENKVILQYTIDVMHELAQKKENLVYTYDNHELFLFKTKDWHILFYQHDNNGKVYFEKRKNDNDEPFRYALFSLKEAEKENKSVEEFMASYDFSFGSVNYDISKVYESKRMLEVQHTAAVHFTKDEKQAAILEKAWKEVDYYHYRMPSPQELLNSIEVFKELNITAIAPSIKEIEHFGKAYANCFSDSYQKLVVDNLNKTKKLCAKHNINELSDSFSYHDQSVYYHNEQKALIFHDQNMGFVAFENGKNSWEIVQFSNMYSNIESSDYYFENKPEFKDLTLKIEDGQFINAGFNMYSLHFNVLYTADEIKKAYSTTKQKKNKM